MNTDYRKLDSTSNNVPRCEALLPYALEILKDGREIHKNEFRKRVIKLLAIPDDIVNIKYPNHPDAEGILMDRLNYVLSDLFKAKAVERTKRGVYKVTDFGIGLLDKYGENLDYTILKQQEPYLNYLKELKIRNEKSGIESSYLQEGNTEEQDLMEVENIVTSMKNMVATELLEKVRASDPIFFETLVVKLLVGMGYSGTNGNAYVTKPTNDGGIDGVINQDPLGTSTVYIQAKRYAEDNKVGRAAIQSFYGALADVHADRGVFITTSDYSKGAIDFAKNQGIVLINGIELTDLMIQYEIGVEPIREYKLYRIDNDYFEEE
ncbi:restriction endonuclease [Vagococcus bubulae]|uniref:Restriction endonuclease n=1 Tax=Vagococcus bubulae TaxID=1977868 RepID=A0A429ZRC7_9ENTE|nr:restriction endonuclease [Vagococcus bubulae]RST96253.1 restriction endonuclease [Vagococcus bubulae]